MGMFNTISLKTRVTSALVSLSILVCWVWGIHLAESSSETFWSIIFPPYGWYLVFNNLAGV